MNFKFVIENNLLRAENEILLCSGNMNTYIFEFAFGEEWKDFAKYAIFIKNSIAYNVIISGNSVVVPAEALETPGDVLFGVFGSSDDEQSRLSTNMILLKVERGAYCNANAPIPPTADIWEQLVTKTIPKIGENGNWYIYDMNTGCYLDTGIKSGDSEHKYKNFIIKLSADENGNFTLGDVTFGDIEEVYKEGGSIYIDMPDEDSTNLLIPCVAVSNNMILFDVREKNKRWTVSITSDNVISYQSACIGEQMVDELVEDANAYPSSLAVKNYIYEQCENLKYYGDTNIIPSDISLFRVAVIDKNDVSKGAEIGGIYRNGTTHPDIALYEGEFVIPYKCNIDGVEYTITKIANSAFSDCYNMTEIKMPNSITTIGDFAFGGCYRIRNIKIPNGVTYIGENAFLYCSRLTEIEIPDSVRAIKRFAFSGCTGLKSVIIPNSVVEIESGIFMDCNNLSDVTILADIKSIGNAFFAGCAKLTDITIPNSVTSIVDAAFYNCTSLTSITIPDSVTSIGNIFNNMDLSKLVIKCYSGSMAEKYAKTKNIPYILIDAPIISKASESTTNGTTTYSVTLEHGKNIRLGELPNLTLIMPDVISDVYKCSLSFTSIGDNGTSMSYSGKPITWRGEDVDGEGVFIPQADTMYEIDFKYINTKTITDESGKTTIEPVIVARVSIV